MSIDIERVRDFLDRYAATLTEFDADGAVRLRSTPGMIIDGQISGVLAAREAMAEGLRQSYPLYRRLGLASVGYELLDHNALSEVLILVRVRWLFLDADGALLTDANSYYLLRDEEVGLQACVCVETDSAEKLQALMAERDPG